MAISENTRSHDTRRWEEVYQKLQQSTDEFKEHQNHVNDQLRELITGLSRQVLQIASNGGTGEISSGNSNQPFCRLSRIEFPRFSGEDVLRWVYRCEQFFDVDQTAEHVQVKVAVIHLTGKALLWHQSFMKSRGMGEWPSWAEYKIAISTRLRPKPFDDTLAELMKLKQMESVEQYQEYFDSLLNRVELPTSYAVSCFLSGLNDEVQHGVRMFRPSTLHDGYCLAKLLETTLASIAKRTKPLLEQGPPITKGIGSKFGSSPHAWNSASHRTGPTVSSYRSPAVSSTGSTSSKAKTGGRTLSSKEIDERRAKNLCFFCEEKYFPGHKCSAQVHRLEVIEEEGIQGEEGTEEVGEGMEGEETEVLEVVQLSLLP